MHSDLGRRLFVTLSGVFCIVGTLVGVGVIGTSVANTAGGALDSDATLIAPAGTAFSIWSVIYVGLFLYTVRQWLPSVAETTRERRIGWLAGVSMVLNAAWLLVIQGGWLWLSVLVILALAVVLGVLVKRLHEHPHTTLVGRVIVDGTFGLYLGWVTAAATTNVAAAGTAEGWGSGGTADEWIAVAVLVVAVLLTAVYARLLGPRFTVAAAVVWALVWIGVARTSGEPASQFVGTAAFGLAAVTLLIWIIALVRDRNRGTRALDTRAGRERSGVVAS